MILVRSSIMMATKVLLSRSCENENKGRKKIDEILRYIAKEACIANLIIQRAS